MISTTITTTTTTNQNNNNNHHTATNNTDDHHTATNNTDDDNHNRTVSFHNFKSQNFKLSVSNPKNTYVAYVSVLSQISNCQGLGRKNKHEVLKTDRTQVISGRRKRGGRDEDEDVDFGVILLSCCHNYKRLRQKKTSTPPEKRVLGSISLKHMYIYIYIYRERERYIQLYIYIYIYIYVYVYVYIYI